MVYIVERIAGEIRIDTQGGHEERQRKREQPPRRGDGRDSVTISDEARRRSQPERSGDDDPAGEL